MNEEKLTIKDIVGLALKGWSKDDIKELFELAKSKEDSSDDGGQKTPENGQAKEKPEEGNAASEDKPKEGKTSEDEPKENSDDIDSLKKEILELKKQLKEAQTNNTSSDLSDQTDKQTDIDVINDLARSFM